MSERAYTVNEIQYMRQCLRGINIRPNVPFYQQEMDARIEDQLRTYMEAGTDPSELERQQSEMWRMDQEMEDRRVNEYYYQNPERHPVWEQIAKWLHGTQGGTAPTVHNG